MCGGGEQRVHTGGQEERCSWEGCNNEQIEIERTRGEEVTDVRELTILACLY